MDQPHNISWKKDGHIATLQDEFFGNLTYMDTHLSHALRNLIRKLRTFPNQLEIGIGKDARKSIEDQNCQLQHWGWNQNTISSIVFFMKQEGDTIASSNKIMETTNKDQCSELF